MWKECNIYIDSESKFNSRTMIEIGSKSFRELFHVEGMAKEMMLMENPDYPTRTSHCHFALQLQSQCI